MSLYKKPKPKRNTLIKEDDIDYVSSDSESDPEYPLEPKNNPEARILGPVYFPFKEGVLFRTAVSDRQENPVVFMDISAVGGRRLRTGEITKFRLLGRLHFELRKDLVPMTCQNFMGLITGFKGVGKDGVRYCYKGRYLHRIVRGQFFQGGDLLDEKGNCSKSALNEGYFADENFIFRHTGPGCLSMSNKGPDSNGSIFQVTFQQMPEMDERYGAIYFFSINFLNSQLRSHFTYTSHIL